MIFQDSSSPTQPSGYGKDDSSVEMPADDVGVYGENEFSPGPEADETDLEVRPEYAGGVFSLPQVRYCVRQSERIERAEAMVFSSDQRQRFNSAVSDFNLRCSSFRYDSSDMTTVRAEIFGMQDRLQSEARDIVGSATDLTVPSYTPPVTSDFGLEEPDSTESTPAAEDVEADTENPLGEASDF